MPESPLGPIVMFVVRRQLSAPLRYASAPLAILVAVLVQYAVLPEPAIAPFVIFHFMIALVSSLAGRGPGLLAVALSAVAANFLFVPPYRAWAMSTPALTATALFVMSAAAVALLCGAVGEALDAALAARRSAERAKRSAEEANRTKDHFLAVLSHELRTPLTPVLTGVSLLQKDRTLGEQARKYLDVIRRNVDPESRLIDDLLDVTRIARGTIDLDKRRVELCSIIERAVDVCRADIEARGLHFGVDFGAGPYVVEADAARLQQVFWNLLKNAIKFTPHGGCVGISCRAFGGHAIVEVMDSGMGIDQSALGVVFDAFVQAQSSMRQQFGGLGLGLAISKALVEAHGGTIEAHSEGRDRGATFRVQLPVISAESPRVVERVAPSPPRPAAADRPGLRVLLVEDHGDTAEMMVSVLEADGHHVEIAGDVATAVETAARGQFDVLVSDLGLPDGSGLDLMRTLRSRGHTLPGVAVSGYGREHDVEQSRTAGFWAHLVKPVDPDRLLEVLRAAVARDR